MLMFPTPPRCPTMAAVVCPYCSHGMNPKAARAGQFTPKCPKCGRPFQLTVTMTGDAPSFRCAPLPDDTAAPGPGVSSAAEAEFSVAASALRSVPADPDATAA